jgi:hypothetical protein
VQEEAAMPDRKPDQPEMPHTQTSAPVKDAPAEEVRPDIRRDASQEQERDEIPNLGEDPGAGI